MCVSSTSNDYAERTVEILNTEGLHMRPAMQFVDCASGFKSKIRVEKDTQVADGKSIMQVIILKAEQGDKLKVIASGSDAQKAVDTLAEFLERSTLEKL
jgi:phosphotransferase system HPr (HPr) family protein